MIRRIALLFCCAAVALVSNTFAQAQTTNQGTDFYLGFPQNYAGETPNLRLFITGNSSTNGTVAVPGIGFSMAYSVTPGTITTVTLPAAAQSSGNGSVDSLGIHVTAKAPVTVYGLNSIPFTTDAYLGLPAQLLGTEHIVLGYTGGGGGPSEFQVVGSQDNTQVTITPSTDAPGHPANVAFTVTLNQLQTYQLQATSTATDLSGTIITSTKPIALFGGSVCTEIPNEGYSACDYVVEQIPATGTWGEDFLTVPLASRSGGDTFRVIARDAGTKVTIDGTLVTTLGKAQIYQTLLNSTSNHSINTSGPALVAQYANSSSFDNTTGDPFMMLISPTEQFQTSYTVSTPSTDPEAFTNYINVVALTSSESACRVDGTAISTFHPIGSASYSGAQIPVGIGTHNLSCPNAFGVYSYGFYDYDGYGYPGGLGLKFISTPRCDVNGDGQIDSKDINLIFAARNTPASSAEDERDADGDLQITVADARVCQQRCTHAFCAVQ